MTIYVSLDISPNQCDSLEDTAANSGGEHGIFLICGRQVYYTIIAVQSPFVIKLRERRQPIFHIIKITAFLVAKFVVQAVLQKYRLVKGPNIKNNWLKLLIFFSSVAIVGNMDNMKNAMVARLSTLYYHMLKMSFKLCTI